MSKPVFKSFKSFSAVIAVLSLIFSALFGVAPATAAIQGGGTASITGTALLTGVAPGANINVTLRDSVSNLETVTTDGTGGFAFTNIAAGSYTLYFEPVTAGTHVPEYFDGKATLAEATPIVVADGELSDGNDVSLAGYGSISGRVLGAGAIKTPLENATVTLYDIDGRDLGRTATTNSNGEFTISTLTAGDYKLGFTPPQGSIYLPRYFQASDTLEEADVVTLTDGQNKTGLVDVLPKPSSIAGTVKAVNLSGGSPVIADGALVEALNKDGESVASANAAADGTYVIEGLAAGNYRVRFTPASDDADHTAVYYSGKATFESSAVVAVGLSQDVTGIDDVLPTFATISGVVKGGATASTARILAGAAVEAFDEENNSLGSTETDDKGAYTLEGIPPGLIRVQFTPNEETSANYVSEWWNHKPTFEQATGILVASGQKITGINPVLPTWSSISGTVKGYLSATSSQVLEGVNVEAFDAWGNSAGTATTDEKGAYKIENLLAGSYRVLFSPDPEVAPDWTNIYFGNKFSLKKATKISLSSSQDLKGKDAILPKWSSISGTVTGKDDLGVNGPLSDVNVSLINEAGETIDTQGTEVDGTYKFESLIPGTYLLYFEESTQDHADQYYGGGHSIDQAVPLIVAPNQNPTGINANLARWSTLGGTVTGDSGTGAVGIPGITVYIYDSNGEYVANAWTEQDGTFKTEGLYAGIYRVEFNADDSPFLSTWYGGGNQSTSTAINLAEGTDKADLNQQLNLGGTISGTVKNALGVAQSGVVVQATTLNGTAGPSAITDLNGFYKLIGLDNNSYNLYFSSGDNYVSTYFGGSLTASGSTPVAIENLGNLENVDVTLVAGTTLKGRVFATVNSAPEGIMANVDAYTPAGVLAGSATSDLSGDFQLDGLAAGTYTLQFTTEDNYVSVWWDGNQDQADAEYFTVGEAVVVTGFNQELIEGASISGTVIGTNTDGDQYLEGATVDVYDESGTLVKTTTTDGDGAYYVTGLLAGSYTLHVDTEENYIPLWYEDSTTQDQATIIDLESGESFDSADVYLGSGATITGVVSGAGTVVDLPLKNVLVEAYDSFGNVVASGYSDDSGIYSLVGLGEGDYRVKFSPTNNYVAGWYGDVDYFGSAEDVAVGASETVSGIDIALDKGNSITGNVALPGSEGDQSGIVVTVYDDFGAQVKQTTTDDLGDYVVFGLKAGSYDVHFDANGRNYLSEWFDNASTEATATQVELGKTSSFEVADATLAQGAALKITVTDSLSKPAAGAQIDVYTAAGSLVLSGTADDAGVYTALGLAAGSYKLFFDGSPVNLKSVYSGGASKLAAASSVVLAAGDSNTPVVQVLEAGARLQGVVTGDSQPSVGVVVSAIDTEGSVVGSDATNENGEFSIEGLAGGSYKLFFDNGDNNLIDEYSGNSATLAAASSTSLAAGETLTGINADLAVGGRISGKVAGNNTEAAPAVGVQVVAYVGSSANVAATATTDQGGNYEIFGLASGSYTVKAIPSLQKNSPFNYVSAKYFGTGATGTAIAVTAGAEQGAKNIGLEPAFTISGRVKSYNASGNRRVVGGTVKAYLNAGTTAAATATTDIFGSYTLVLPATGSYKVEFVAPAGFSSEFSRDKATLAAADPYVAIAGGLESNVNAVLTPSSGALKFSATPTPTVSGEGLVGNELTATIGNWDEGADLYVQWYRGGVAIDGANDLVYLLTSDDAGSSVTVAVTGAKDGYTSVTKTSAAVALPKPSVTKISPTSAAPRSTVTITGKGFVGITAVRFNGLNAVDFKVVSATKITASFTGPSASASIEIVGTNGTTKSSKKFTLKTPKPTLKSFKATSGAEGDEITLTGTNLLDTLAIKFGTVETLAFEIVNSKTIKVLVPAGAESGYISVVGYGGTAKSTKKFKVN